jgi:hypothetical protein
VCKEDGIWFDSGELASVLVFIESGGLQRAQQREIEERDEQLRRDKVKRALELAGPRAHAPVTASMRTELATELVQAIVEWWKT